MVPGPGEKRRLYGAASGGGAARGLRVGRELLADRLDLWGRVGPEAQRAFSPLSWASRWLEHGKEELWVFSKSGTSPLCNYSWMCRAGKGHAMEQIEERMGWKFNVQRPATCSACCA